MTYCMTSEICRDTSASLDLVVDFLSDFLQHLALLAINTLFLIHQARMIELLQPFFLEKNLLLKMI